MITAEREEPRLINFLAELCQCDPAKVEWDGEGSTDTVGFESDGFKVLLKLSREPASRHSRNFMDFRVRVIINN